MPAVRRGTRKVAAGPGRSRLSADARRGQITRGALTLFAARGFERTTTREIAREAGISEGTIYRYYGSKEEILFSFLKSRAVETLAELFDSLEGAGEERVIREFFANRFSLVSGSPELQKVLLGEALFNPRLAGELSRKVFMPALGILERYIAGRIRAGAFRPVDASLAARVLVGQFLTFTVWNAVLGPGKRIPDAALPPGLASLFLDGVRGLPRKMRKSDGGRR